MRPTYQYFLNKLSFIAIASTALLLGACSTTPSVLQGWDMWKMPKPGPIQPGLAKWIPAQWQNLPGWNDDNLETLWTAWTKSCQRPSNPAFYELCPQIRMMSLGTPDEKRQWIQLHFQPYQIEADTNNPNGLITGYYEPLIEASLTPSDKFNTPLYAPPDDLGKGQWYTRAAITSNPQVQSALKSKVLAYVASPIDALILQIQGSGRLTVKSDTGATTTLYRLSFAASNNQPYVSIGKWLINKGAKASNWDEIRAWYDSHPNEQQALLNTNPRYIFFKLRPLADADQNVGPIGSEGAPLTAGRSVAVDVRSIPLGTPLWFSTSSDVFSANKLVIAQDTGGAINGAVRIDYFTGWGEEAGNLAGKLKQDVQLWALWPKPLD